MLRPEGLERGERRREFHGGGGVERLIRRLLAHDTTVERLDQNALLYERGLFGYLRENVFAEGDGGRACGRSR